MDKQPSKACIFVNFQDCPQNLQQFNSFYLWQATDIHWSPEILISVKVLWTSIEWKFLLILIITLKNRIKIFMFLFFYTPLADSRELQCIHKPCLYTYYVHMLLLIFITVSRCKFGTFTVYISSYATRTHQNLYILLLLLALEKLLFIYYSYCWHFRRIKNANVSPKNNDNNSNDSNVEDNATTLVGTCSVHSKILLTDQHNNYNKSNSSTKWYINCFPHKRTENWKEKKLPGTGRITVGAVIITQLLLAPVTNKINCI